MCSLDELRRLVLASRSAGRIAPEDLQIWAQEVADHQPEFLDAPTERGALSHFANRLADEGPTSPVYDAQAYRASVIDIDDALSGTRERRERMMWIRVANLYASVLVELLIPGRRSRDCRKRNGNATR